MSDFVGDSRPEFPVDMELLADRLLLMECLLSELGERRPPPGIGPIARADEKQSFIKNGNLAPEKIQKYNSVLNY